MECVRFLKQFVIVKFKDLDDINPVSYTHLVQVKVGERELGIGCGRTKQAAGQQAAHKTMEQLKIIFNDGK